MAAVGGPLFINPAIHRGARGPLHPPEPFQRFLLPNRFNGFSLFPVTAHGPLRQGGDRQEDFQPRRTRSPQRTPCSDDMQSSLRVLGVLRGSTFFASSCVFRGPFLSTCRLRDPRLNPRTGPLHGRSYPPQAAIAWPQAADECLLAHDRRPNEKDPTARSARIVTQRAPSKEQFPDGEREISIFPWRRLIMALPDVSVSLAKPSDSCESI